MALIYCPDCNREVSDKADKCPNCAYPIHTLNKTNPSPVSPSLNQSKDLALILLQQKNKGLGFVLTLLFGPIGMLYASVKHALIMMAITLVIFIFMHAVLDIPIFSDNFFDMILAFPSMLFVTSIIWIISIFVTINVIDSHNSNIIIKLKDKPKVDVSSKKEDDKHKFEGNTKLLIQLKGLINSEKSRIIFDPSNREEIIDMVESLCPTKEDALKLINAYNSLFDLDLINDLKSLSTSYNMIKKMVLVFIELGILDSKYPHKMLVAELNDPS